MGAHVVITAHLDAVGAGAAACRPRDQVAQCRILAQPGQNAPPGRHARLVQRPIRREIRKIDRLHVVPGFDQRRVVVDHVVPGVEAQQHQVGIVAPPLDGVIQVFLRRAQAELPRVDHLEDRPGGRAAVEGRLQPPREIGLERDLARLPVGIGQDQDAERPRRFFERVLDVVQAARVGPDLILEFAIAAGVDVTLVRAQLVAGAAVKILGPAGQRLESQRDPPRDLDQGQRQDQPEAQRQDAPQGGWPARRRDVTLSHAPASFRAAPAPVRRRPACCGPAAPA